MIARRNDDFACDEKLFVAINNQVIQHFNCWMLHDNQFFWSIFALADLRIDQTTSWWEIS